MSIIMITNDKEKYYFTLLIYNNALNLPGTNNKNATTPRFRKLPLNV